MNQKRASGYPHALSKPDKISVSRHSESHFLIHSRNSLQVESSDGPAVAIYSRAGNRVLRTNCPQRHERCDRAAEETRRLRFTAPFPVPNKQNKNNVKSTLAFNGVLTSKHFH